MKLKKSLPPLIIVLFLLMYPLVSAAIAQTEKGSRSESRPTPNAAIARIWHGRTPTAKAEEYFGYLNEAGIKKIEAIAGNLGVQVFRRTTGEVTEFTVISYWVSRDAIRQFAGDDIEKTHNLPKDPEYLLELEPTVKHYEVMLNEWKP